MTPLTLDALRELVPGYVMGTLSIDETRAFEVAMMDAATAAAIEPEIMVQRAVVHELLTAFPAEPPVTLKSRVLARLPMEGGDVVQSPEVSTVSTPVSVASVIMPKGTTSGTLAAGMPTPARASRMAPAPVRKRPRAGGRGGWYASGALAVALAAAVVFAVDLRRENDVLATRLRAQERVSARNAEQLTERERTLASLLDAGGDLTLVRLTAQAPQGPDMQLFWNTRSGRALVNATGLSPVASGRAYCLWVIRDGKPTAVRMFNVDATGRAVISDVVLPTDLAGIAAFAVTEEADGALPPAPTTTPFLVGAVPKG